MNLTDFFDNIESRHFAGNLRILSGFKVVLLVLQDDETLKQLVVHLQTAPEHQQVVLQHLLDLLTANDQPQYAHPFDAAIAAYLYALSQVDVELSQRAISAILETPQLWWARRLARQLQPAQIVSENSP